MIWLLLFGGAVGGRILLARLRSGPQTPFVRSLLFDFKIRRGPVDQPPSRRDRLINSAATLLGGAACLAAGAGFMAWADRFPNLSTTNHILSGVGFVFVMVAVLVVISALVELIRAPFSPKRSGA